MKSICILTILLAAILTNLNARNIVEDTEYTLVETFGQHDFPNATLAFDWVFTVLSTGITYQLQGSKPTEYNVLGWEEVPIKTPDHAWYMFSLNGNGSTKSENEASVTNSKYSRNEKGLFVYAQNLLPASYKLDQLTNDEFNALSRAQKLQVADKLLSTLFFGYPLKVLEEKMTSENFINIIKSNLTREKIDGARLESYIDDEKKFKKNPYGDEVNEILRRFYVMNELDGYFLKNWIAYTLMQTIMFSPALGLSTVRLANVDNIYNHLVTSLNNEMGMRYVTYEHMKSEDNWRRFRSPEDNGREMLEIFLLDFNDSHVPIAAQALKNWKLDRVGFNHILKIGSNENTNPLKLFDTTIYRGDDFYRELAKSNLFTQGVVKRLVERFFPNLVENKRKYITNIIVSSNPETWQDILLQIIFSEEYLLYNSRTKNAEEVFFPLTKKMNYKHNQWTFSDFRSSLIKMGQASMQYKLGRLNRVPLDPFLFSNYHYFVRTRLLLKRSNPEHINDYDAWEREGWSDSFIAYNKFDYNSSNVAASLDSLIHYLFKTTIAREATTEELKLFHEHMLTNKKALNYVFNMFVSYDDKEKQKKVRESRKRVIAFTVLDYISRLDAIYTQREVQ